MLEQTDRGNLDDIESQQDAESAAVAFALASHLSIFAQMQKVAVPRCPIRKAGRRPNLPAPSAPSGANASAVLPKRIDLSATLIRPCLKVFSSADEKIPECPDMGAIERRRIPCQCIRLWENHPVVERYDQPSLGEFFRDHGHLSQHETAITRRGVDGSARKGKRQFTGFLGWCQTDMTGPVGP